MNSATAHVQFDFQNQQNRRGEWRQQQEHQGKHQENGSFEKESLRERPAKSFAVLQAKDRRTSTVIR